MSEDEYGKTYNSVTFGDFEPWKSNTTGVSFTEMYTSFLEYSDGPFVEEGGDSRPYTVSVTRSESMITTRSETMSVSVTLSKESAVYVESETYVPSYVMIETNTVVEWKVTFYFNEASSEEDRTTMSAGLVIGLGAGGGAILFVMAFTVLYIWRHKDDGDEISISEEEKESNEEVESEDEGNLLFVTGEWTNAEEKLAATLGGLSATIMELNEGKAEVNYDDMWLD